MKGGRRTRKASAWAAAAGKYWREHKNDPDINEFSDVLKSAKFRAEYYGTKNGKSSNIGFNKTGKKYGKKMGKKMNKTKRGRKMNKFDEEEKMEEKMEENMEEKIEKNMEEEDNDEEMKEDKKNKKYMGNDEDWEEKPNHKQQIKADYFNGGKK